MRWLFEIVTMLQWIGLSVPSPLALRIAKKKKKEKLNWRRQPEENVILRADNYYRVRFISSIYFQNGN